MVPPYSVWISRVRTYSGSRSLRSRFDYRAFTFFGWASHPILLRLLLLSPVLTPGVLLPPVWPLSLSLAATNKIDVSFSSSGYLDVSVHRVPLHTLWIGVWMIRVLRTGFPHSDICGSRIICISPQLFAAYHVFLRLLVPRHPPCALFCLITAIICLQMIALCTPRVAPFMRAHPVSEMLFASFHCSSLAIALAIFIKELYGY